MALTPEQLEEQTRALHEQKLSMTMAQLSAVSDVQVIAEMLRNTFAPDDLLYTVQVTALDKIISAFSPLQEEIKRLQANNANLMANNALLGGMAIESDDEEKTDYEKLMEEL